MIILTKTQENISSMIHVTATTREPAIQVNETSNAKQKTEILTTNTTEQVATASAILALPTTTQQALKSMPALLSSQQHSIVVPPPPLPLLIKKMASKTAFESLITKETTLTSTSTLALSSYSTTSSTSPSSSSSLLELRPAATHTLLATTATKVSLKIKEILQTVAGTITTANVKCSFSCSSNNSSKNCKSNNSNRNLWSKTIKTLTNEYVSRHRIIQENDKNEFHHHMLSLNHQNFTNVLQHTHQQQQQQYEGKRNRPHQQQQQRQLSCNIKQFLLLLTCFVAIITIFSLPQTVAATSKATQTTIVIAKVPTTTTAHGQEKDYTSSITMAINETYKLQHKHKKHKQHQQQLTLSFSSPSNNLSKNSNNDGNNNSNIKSFDNNNNIEDNTPTSSHPITPFSVPIETALEATTTNSTNNSSSSRNQSQYKPIENHIVSRLVRSLDVSGSATGVGSSGISSIFGSSAGGGSGGGSSPGGLTNIFNQNLDTGLGNNIECPSFDESSACPCYKFEDGKYKNDF